MRFQLVFENTGDSIPFDIVHNRELMQFFVEKANANSQNLFSNDRKLASEIDSKIAHLHWAISKSNEVMYTLTDASFEQKNNLTDYLDQNFLNKLHCDWVFSQNHIVNIDEFRYSSNSNKAMLGNILHEKYPDEIRKIRLAEALKTLGYIYPYEEVNLGVHRLEGLFERNNLEFSAEKKWEVFPNPFVDTLVSNNDVANFSFGYTYVGRQYYDKFINFDDNLTYNDHYNYETLEFSFQLNLSKPQTIPYSKEFLDWSSKQSVKLVTNQIPIGNIPDLATNLFEYRNVLYRNSRDNNRVSIILN
jgi:hypothetical protein